MDFYKLDKGENTYGSKTYLRDLIFSQLGNISQIRKLHIHEEELQKNAQTSVRR